jgi:hypothetical protein
MTTRNCTRLRIWGALFIALILLGGCAPSSYFMTNVSRVDEVDSEHAIVTFLRPQVSKRYDKDILVPVHIYLDVWDGKELVGILIPRCYIQYEAEPGEHLFLVVQEYQDSIFSFPWARQKWRFVSVNLQKGKHYYILASSGPYRPVVDPIQKDDTRDRSRIESWLSILKPTALKTEEAESYAYSKISYVIDAIAEFESGLVQYKVMDSNDWR